MRLKHVQNTWSSLEDMYAAGMTLKKPENYPAFKEAF
jgi:hypothetical protein